MPHERSHLPTVPLSFVKTADGVPVLRAAEGVKLTIDQTTIEQRFESKPVKSFRKQYQEAGGDPRRLHGLLLALLPVSVQKPPTRRTLDKKLEKACQVLSEIIYLPGSVYKRKLYEDAFFALSAFRAPGSIEMYLKQFKPEKPKPFVVEDYDPELFHDLDSGELLVPPIGAPRPGHPRSGSPTGLILGVLAKECRQRFGAPRWRDILAIACAMAPEMFDIKEETVERLQKRVAHAGKSMVDLLHSQLFSPA